MLNHKLSLPSEDQALPGRDTPIAIENKHFTHGRPIFPPFNADFQIIYFGLGCFWGAERKFWPLDGVYTTAVGYAAGITPNPTYEEVCSGLTGHNEVVMVVYDPQTISFENLLSVFFESHNPTQGMQQGNDIGTQYRSGIYTTNKQQHDTANYVSTEYQKSLSKASFSSITTEILEFEQFYYAEQYHQQYLAKNPNGYCGLGGTGISCTI